jgi:hypothetical protein
MQARDLSICPTLSFSQDFQMTEKKIGVLSSACPLLRPNAICIRNAIALQWDVVSLSLSLCSSEQLPITCWCLSCNQPTKNDAPMEARLHRDSRYVRAFIDVMHRRPTSKSVAKRDTTLRLLAAPHMSVTEYLTVDRAKITHQIFVRFEMREGASVI